MGQDSVTVKDAWHLYCEIVLQQASEKSRKTEEGRWKNYISKPFSSQLICEIKAIDIARFRSSLERRGAKRNTVSFTSSEIKVVLTTNQA